MTVATTSRTQPRVQQKEGTLLSPVLNPNPLYSIVGPVSIAKVKVNNVTGTTTNVMTPVYATKLGLEPQPIMNLMKR